MGQATLINNRFTSLCFFTGILSRFRLHHFTLMSSHDIFHIFQQLPNDTSFSLSRTTIKNLDFLLVLPKLQKKVMYILNAAVYRLSKRHAKLIPTEQDSLLVIQKSKASYCMIRNLKGGKMSSAKIKYIAFVNHLYRVRSWETDSLKTRERNCRQFFCLCGHICTVKITVICCMIKVVVSISNPFYWSVGQTLTVCAEITASIA